MTVPPARRRSSSTYVLTALALVAVLLAGCSGGSGGSDVAGQGFVSGGGTITTVTAGDRGKPVRFAGTTLDGKPFDLRDHRGEVVVVNVWWSGCAPCIAEAPGLQKVWADTADKGVQFIGVNTQDNTAAARAHEKRFGVTYPSVDDDGGRIQLSLRGTLPPTAIPSTLVLDRQGRVSARVIGLVRAATLRALVSDALAEADPA
jgi:thiol-disulfide isomerase/thioredoxin